MSGLRWYEGKRLVSNVRGSDYAHAGEEEAITQCFEPFLKNTDRQILDAGCGQGGTAHYIQTEGWGKVTGFDVEEKSITYAKQKYLTVDFITSDVSAINQNLAGKKFDLICMFNAFYAFPDQSVALKNLHSLANKNADLIIFDYTDLAPAGANPLIIRHDPVKAFLPIRFDTIGMIAKEAGWATIAIKDFSADYQKWYKNLVNLIMERKNRIISEFSEQWYLKALTRYTGLSDAIQEKLLGGGVFYGKAI